MKKTIRLAIRLKDQDDVSCCAWCFTYAEDEDTYCSECGRYFDTEIEPVGDFEDLFKHINILNEI